LDGPAPIPQTDPKAAYLAHREAIDAAIRGVMESGSYVLGEELRAFEREFAAYLGVPYAVGVASGTDAIELALRALEIGPGDFVITVSHTAAATVAAIERSGARVFLVDIDPNTYTMDPNRLEEALRRAAPAGGRWRAVVPVHLYGQPAEMTSLMDVARRHDLRVVEDCAQSHGASLCGRLTGTFGDLGAFSFYPTKNLGAFGDGGMVVTADAGLAERVRSLRQYGWLERYVSAKTGVNSRLDEIQAAILRVRLRYLAEENGRRQAIAAAYDHGLAGKGILRPYVAPGAVHVYHQYVVRTADRSALRSFLSEKGIVTAIHYPAPIHLQAAYRDRVPHAGALGNTERIIPEILSLPMYPQLADRDVERIVDACSRWRTNRAPG
jgi:dTDP-4-amino-4,6-dideoxygalactose transaminase